MKNLNYYIFSAVIFVLLTCLLFTCNQTGVYRKENKKLNQEYKEIEKDKKALGKELAKLQTKYDVLDKADKSLKDSIGKVETHNNKLKKDLGKAKNELAAYRRITPITTGDSLCDNVIAEYDTLVAGLNLEISLKDSIIIIKDDKIYNLNKQLINRELAYVMTNEQLGLQQGIIDNQRIQVRKLKTNNIILGTTGGAVALGLILGLILK
jgi:uncharacterized protein (DUF3084 family)